MNTENKTPTPTEVLVEAMEKLGESESQQVIVVIRDSNGIIQWTSNLPCITDRCGMLYFALECQRQMIWEERQKLK